MSEAAKSPKKKAAAPKKPADHPSYFDMIKAAISTLKERNGSSRQAIEKYIKANYKVGDSIGPPLKLALKKNTANGKLVHTKGVGASGSFKLSQALKAEKPPADKPKKKVAAKPKKPTAKPKKPAAKKVTKKPAAKKPAKKAAAKKPAAKKSPKKAAAKKPAAKKAEKKPAAKKATKKTATKKSAKK